MKKGSCVRAVAVGPGGLELRLVEGAADKQERNHGATEREDRIGQKGDVDALSQIRGA